MIRCRFVAPAGWSAPLGRRVKLEYRLTFTIHGLPQLSIRDPCAVAHCCDYDALTVVVYQHFQRNIPRDTIRLRVNHPFGC